MSQFTLKILKKSIHQNDVKTFRSTLEAHGLPDRNRDYDLLIKSLRLGRKRMVNLLLDKGCRPSKSSNNRPTPLHVVVTKAGWSSVALKLLARGARVGVRDDNGDTPIHAAFASDAAGSVIDLLLKCYTRETLVDVVNKDGLGLLHIACTRPHLDVVRDLVDIGGSNILSQVSLQTNSKYAGYSSLHFAVENRRHKIAKFLCQYEADVGILNGRGSTPLHLAVHRRDVKMIDILLRYADWNVNHTDSVGVTHFMAACAGSDPEIVKQHLRIATDTSPDSLVHMISARVKSLDDCPFAGYTPMHFVAEFGRLESMQLLMDRGAHCAMTEEKLSPLDLARKRNHETITALLERHCKTCEVCVPSEKNTDDEVLFVLHHDCNENEKKSDTVYRLDSTFSDTSLDECCLLDIFPLPEQINQIGDCELCKLQEIFMIDDGARVHRDDDLRENVRADNVRRTRRKSTSVVCSFRVNFDRCKYFFNGQYFTLFVTILSCVSIVSCIVLIASYKNNIHGK